MLNELKRAAENKYFGETKKTQKITFRIIFCWIYGRHGEPFLAQVSLFIAERTERGKRGATIVISQVEHRFRSRELQAIVILEPS